MIQELTDPKPPHFPRKALVLPGSGRCVVLGVATLELEMAKLRVRDQHAIDKHGTADSGAEREETNQTGDAFRRSISELGDSSCVRIIQQRSRHSKPPLELRPTVHAYPGIVDVGGRFDHPVPHHRRERATHRTLVSEVINDLGNNLENRSRVGGSWCVDPMAPFSQITHRQVDGGSLDSGAADVDAEYIPFHDGNCT